MNCTWEGPRVRDILLFAGLQEHAMQNGVAPKHVHFANYGGKTQADEWYGGSIPLERAMDPAMDVILAVKVGMQTHKVSFHPFGRARLLIVSRLGHR